MVAAAMPGWRAGDSLRQLPRLRRCPPAAPSRAASWSTGATGPRVRRPLSEDLAVVSGRRAGALRARGAARPLPRAPARGDDPAALPRQLRHRRRREPRAVRPPAAARGLPGAHRLLRARGGDVRAAPGLGRRGSALVRPPLRARSRGVRGHHAPSCPARSPPCSRRPRSASDRYRQFRDATTRTPRSTGSTPSSTRDRGASPTRRLFLKLDTEGATSRSSRAWATTRREVCGAPVRGRA